ncbi:hypothetical protein [Nocardia sp. NPDC056100]|uniref:hypothetical protein n=1 Tax=Nocardia sp. NPDC056100 TaxID=3345712 RepID=UPI0035DFEDFA
MFDREVPHPRELGDEVSSQYDCLGSIDAIALLIAVSALASSRHVIEPFLGNARYPMLAEFGAHPLRSRIPWKQAQVVDYRLGERAGEVGPISSESDADVAFIADPQPHREPCTATWSVHDLPQIHDLTRKSNHQSGFRCWIYPNEKVHRPAHDIDPYFDDGPTGLDIGNELRHDSGEQSRLGGHQP